MSLNDCRDEAGNFLISIDAGNEGIESRVEMLERELHILKAALNEPNKLRHQIYDMLFLLFEIASDCEFDLDSEWDAGKKKEAGKVYSIITIKTRS